MNQSPNNSESNPPHPGAAGSEIGIEKSVRLPGPFRSQPEKRVRKRKSRFLLYASIGPALLLLGLGIVLAVTDCRCFAPKVGLDGSALYRFSEELTTTYPEGAEVPDIQGTSFFDLMQRSISQGAISYAAAKRLGGVTGLIADEGKPLAPEGVIFDGPRSLRELVRLLHSAEPGTIIMASNAEAIRGYDDEVVLLYALSEDNSEVVKNRSGPDTVIRFQARAFPSGSILDIFGREMSDLLESNPEEFVQRVLGSKLPEPDPVSTP